MCIEAMKVEHVDDIFIFVPSSVCNVIVYSQVTWDAFQVSLALCFREGMYSKSRDSASWNIIVFHRYYIRTLKCNVKEGIQFIKNMILVFSFLSNK